MCRLGDIILIKSSISGGGNVIGQHSFIVINEDQGQIQGLDYDFASVVMSSVNTEEEKVRKLGYEFNVEILKQYIAITNGKRVDKHASFVKAEQIHLFNKKKIDYVIIGTVEPFLLKLLIRFIESIPEEKIELIIDNL